MALLNSYTLSQVIVDTKVVADTPLNGIVDRSEDYGNQEEVLTADGMVSPTFAALLGQRPTVDFDCADIETVLDTLGLSGILVDFDETHEGIVFYYRKNKPAGREAYDSAVHFKTVLKNGILVPMSLDAPERGRANIRFQAVPVWDGTNNPFTDTASSALAADPSGVEQAFAVGPVKLNSVMLSGVRSFSINLGNQVEHEVSDSQQYPQGVSLLAHAPEIVIPNIDVTALITTYGREGAALTSANVWLRQLQAATVPYADVQTKHIKLTMTSPMLTFRNVTMMNGRVVPSAVLRPVGATPIAYAKDQAIA